MTTRASRLDSKKRIAFEWFAMSDTERFRLGLPVEKFALSKHLKIGYTTIREWEAKYFSSLIGKQLREDKVIEDNGGIVVLPQAESPKEWIQERWMELVEATMKSAKGGNAQAQKLLMQMGEYVVEKQEVVHKIDGSFVAGVITRAEREAREFIDGVGEVQGELSVLPPKLCLNTGQGKTEDS